MHHVSETCTPTSSDLHHLLRNDRAMAMIRWIFGVTTKDQWACKIPWRECSSKIWCLLCQKTPIKKKCAMSFVGSVVRSIKLRALSPLVWCPVLLRLSMGCHTVSPAPVWVWIPGTAQCISIYTMGKLLSLFPSTSFEMNSSMDHVWTFSFSWQRPHMLMCGFGSLAKSQIWYLHLMHNKHLRKPAHREQCYTLGRL